MNHHSLFLSALALLSITALAKELTFPISPESWKIRTQEPKACTLGKGFLQFDKPTQTTMAQSHQKFHADDYDRVDLQADLQGKGAIQLGFHAYGSNGYIGTFVNAHQHLDSQGKTITISDTRLLGAFTGDYSCGKLKQPILFPCIYVKPGFQGKVSNVRINISKRTPDPNAPIAPTNAGAALRLQHRLQLPRDIYAVEGVETNIYFDNIFLVPCPAQYVFDVSCSKGNNFQKRWSFIPSHRDVGNHHLTLNVLDENGIVATQTATLHVAPKDAGKGKNMSLLMVGDSITDVTTFPQQVFNRFQTPGNPKFRMIGTRPNNPKPGAMAHEGYAGWAWNTFLYTGPFVQQKNGTKVLDFSAYLKRQNQGKAPDVITIQLGVNDIFGSDDFRVYNALLAIEKQMDKLIGEFRRVAPKAIIGIGLATPSAMQDGIGRIYRCGQTRWQYKKNCFMLADMVIRKVAQTKSPNIQVIPMQVGLDCEHNFPMKDYPINQGNPQTIPMPADGVHPAPAGANQLGDTLYAWLKWQLHSRH